MSYQKLKGAMVAKRVKRSELAELLGIHENTLYNKINCKNGDFTIGEAILIRDTYFQGQVLEDLFAKEIAH